MRFRTATGTLLATVLPYAIHFQNRQVHGPPLDYAGLIAAAAAGWAGIPVAGEAALVTAGILAAHGKLNLGPVLLYAWLGATAGGIAGWLIGLKAGRALIGAPGPLLGPRLWALERSELLYERWGALAVFVIPAWAAGIARMRANRFLVLNAVSALLWALLYGIGAYLVGPPIADLVGDLSVVVLLLLAALVAVAGVLALIRRRREHPAQGERRDQTA